MPENDRKNSHIDLEPILEKVESLYETENYQVALEVVESALNSSTNGKTSEYYDLILLQGNLYNELDMYEAAVECYQEILSETAKIQNGNSELIYEALLGLAEVLNKNTISVPSYKKIQRASNRPVLVADLPANLGMCPECGSYVIATRYDYVCYNCGLIVWHQYVEDTDSHEIRGDFVSHMGFYGEIPKTDDKKEINNEMLRQKTINEFLLAGESAIDSLKHELAVKLLNRTSRHLNLKKNVLETARVILHKASGCVSAKAADIVAASIILASQKFSYQLDRDLLYEVIESEDRRPSNHVEEILSKLSQI